MALQRVSMHINILHKLP